MSTTTKKGQSLLCLTGHGSNNTEHYVCASVSSGLVNPSGNKQKMSVTTDERGGLEARLLGLDMLMLRGVPVTGSCHRKLSQDTVTGHCHRTL